jgi:hypothetical protein
MDIGVAALLDLTLRRRRPCHAYFPCDEGSARLRPGPRSFSLLASRLRTPAWAGRRAARSLARLLEAVIFPILRGAGSTGGLRLAGLASTASVRTGLSASAPIASTALASTALAGISRLSAAGVGGGRGGFPVTAASEPIIVGDGAPVIINIGVDPGAGDAGAAYSGSGGCVIRKLNYDSNGKYVGERQIPHC